MIEIVRKSKLNQRGVGKVTLVMVLLFGGSFVMFGLPVISYFYSYEELRGLIEHQAKTAGTRNDFKIKQIIGKEIRRNKLDVNIEEDLIIERSDGHIRIALSWIEVLDIDLGGDYYWELYVFEFDVDETAELPRNDPFS